MTFQPTEEQITAALAHAAECKPLEACGVIADGKYWPLENKATEHDTFVMDRAGYCRVSSAHEIQAIVHSHVYLPPSPSDGDRAMCEKLGLPWVIVSWPLGTHRVIEPCGYRAPLVGRKWAWGSHDCFGLIRDGFENETGILIPDFPRDWMWWKQGGNIIAEQFEQAGFVRLPPGTRARNADVFGMRIESKVVNHLGLFIEPQSILHQLMGRPSARDTYGGFYQQVTELHLRHRALGGEA